MSAVLSLLSSSLVKQKNSFLRTFSDFTLRNGLLFFSSLTGRYNITNRSSFNKDISKREMSSAVRDTETRA